ncbi:hypothetical protein [Streptomyces griseorubiginosus]|uniref:hypothetical protein n=1 Tax=Streptomyces griseorubiginosus TaxID=67304 RepID=UPI001AD60E82|nr:hypothetical protein [Streptomyces griseorubiginosus]MBO4258879.1 hypothetical protein [Streptomyces griseorubiginosus]
MPVPRLTARLNAAVARLVCWTALSAVAAACGPAGTPGPDAVTPAAVRVDARQLLRDAWVTDGRRGYFVDGADSATATPFSLYETAWRLRLAARSGQDPRRLVDPDRMRRWLTTAEQGRLDSSGLPAVAQLDLAVNALLTTGGTVDRTEVAHTLESLRTGGGYRTDPSARTPDAGATAVAVRTLTRLGLPVPGRVRAANSRSLSDLSTVRPADVAPDQVVPLLQTAAALRVTGVDRERAARLAHAAEAALTRLGADPVRLASEGALRDAAGPLGVRLPGFDPATCDGRVRRDGGIALPGGTQSDPQATYWALRLGCSAVRVPAPGAHSRAGWPTEQARESALSASAAAVAVAARSVGGVTEFAGPLARQLREMWLPRAARPAPYDTAELVDRVNLRQIGRALGPSSTHDVDKGLPAPTPRGVMATDDARLLLSTLDARDSTPARHALCSAGSTLRTAAARSGGSLVRAAWLAAAADVCHDPGLRARAMETARTARVTTAVYRAGADPSFEASVLGTWIERPRTDALTAWTHAGLCYGDRCADTPARLRTTDHTPLRTLAVLLAAKAGDYGALFPVAF